MSKILIGMPTRGLIALGTVNFLARQKAQLFCATSNISVCVARRKIVHHFLNNTNFDALLFLDDDIIPPDDTISALAKVNKPIVTANYSLYVSGIIKSCTCTIQCNVNENKYLYGKLDEVGVKEVDGFCGLGCCLIKREVFKKVGIEFNLHYKDGDLVIGEDMDFCNRARQVGYKIFCNYNVVCEHVKPVGLKALYNRYCLSEGGDR